jgi:uncharacterized membrane protein YoaK (UPF0700 family)
MIALELPPKPHATAMQAGLTFIAGFLEACGLIALSGLFIGHIIANIAVLGMAIATHAPGAWTKFISLPVFVAVVALTRMGVHSLGLRGYDAARPIMALVATTLGGFVVGAAAGGFGFLFAGFSSGFAPAAVLLMLIFIREKPGSSSVGQPTGQ